MSAHSAAAPAAPTRQLRQPVPGQILLLRRARPQPFGGLVGVRRGLANEQVH
jgi:hypothetical protein